MLGKSRLEPRDRVGQVALRRRDQATGPVGHREGVRVRNGVTASKQGVKDAPRLVGSVEKQQGVDVRCPQVQRERPDKSLAVAEQILSDSGECLVGRLGLARVEVALGQKRGLEGDNEVVADPASDRDGLLRPGARFGEVTVARGRVCLKPKGV